MSLLTSCLPLHSGLHPTKTEGNICYRKENMTSKYVTFILDMIKLSYSKL